jgi:Zn-dependent alcohol dehydrogenase
MAESKPEPGDLVIVRTETGAQRLATVTRRVRGGAVEAVTLDGGPGVAFVWPASLVGECRVWSMDLTQDSAAQAALPGGARVLTGLD